MIGLWIKNPPRCYEKPRGNVLRRKEYEDKKVCVIGGGLMGRQIALNTAIYPFEVI